MPDLFYLYPLSYRHSYRHWMLWCYWLAVQLTLELENLITNGIFSCIKKDIISSWKEISFLFCWKWLFCILLFVYELEQCIMHHIMRKINDYQCMKSQSKCRHTLTRFFRHNFLLYPCMWEERDTEDSKTHNNIMQKNIHLCSHCHHIPSLIFT